MVVVKIDSFGGMIPAQDKRLLPANSSSLTVNSWLSTGALEGIREPVVAHTLANEFAQKAYRIPKEFSDKDRIVDSYWLEFDSADVDVINSPTINDSFERFYWAGPGLVPQYNTKARIIANTASFLLGVPGPAAAPSVTQPITGAGIQETRAYVYTWVTAYGEEGPPSLPTLLLGWTGNPWNIAMVAPGAGDLANRNLAFVRIYRTITGSGGSTTFYLLAEQDITDLTYVDTSASVTLTGNEVLQSTFWSGPPSDLTGMISMPNGIVAGFRKNEVWFCEPYRPHAWPTQYTVAVEYPVVGLGVIGQSLIVCTTGSPYAISGTNPAAMAISRISSNEPCTCRGSIVSTAMGVVYASPNGIVVAVPGAAQVVTKPIITKDYWGDPQTNVYLNSLRAAVLDGAYYCWGSVLSGCFDAGAFDTAAFLQEDLTGAYTGAVIDTSNPRISYIRMLADAPTFNCFTDQWTGEVFLIRDGQVLWVDVTNTRPHGPYLWRSKVIQTPNKRNLAAMRVEFETYLGSPELNPAPNTAPVQTLAPDQYGLVRVYADGVLRFTREIRVSGEAMRLPSGFKALDWEIEIEGNVKVTSVEVATSMRELRSV